MLGANLAAASQDHGPGHGILQFPYVARPRIRLHGLESGCRQVHAGLSHFLRVALKKEFGQMRDFIGSLT